MISATQLTRAIVWRTLREQRLLLILAPVLVCVGYIALVLIADKAPFVLTRLSRQALEVARSRYFPDMQSDKGLLLAMLATQGPYLISLGASLMAASVSRNLYSAELANGALEVLLSYSIRARQVFIAFLLSALSLTLLAWVLAGLPTITATLLVIGTESSTYPLTARLFALTLLLPFSLGLWSSLTAMFLVSKWPDQFRQEKSALQGIFRLLTALPAIVLLVAANVASTTNPLTITGIGATCGLVATAVVTLLLIRNLRANTILQNI